MRTIAKIMLTCIALFAFAIDPGQTMSMLQDIWEK